jgi:hypothetical protein
MISLSQLRIASPCTTSWEDMAGDDRSRFCSECKLNVYNIAAMTQAQAEALITEKEGRLCARIYQRSDGTIITRDCPVGLARMRRAAWWTLSKVAAVLAMAAGGAAWAMSYANPYREYARLASIQPLNSLTRWLSEPMATPTSGAIVFGGMCAPPLPPMPLAPAAPEIAAP